MKSLVNKKTIIFFSLIMSTALLKSQPIKRYGLNKKYLKQLIEEGRTGGNVILISKHGEIYITHSVPTSRGQNHYRSTVSNMVDDQAHYHNSSSYFKEKNVGF